MSPSRQWRPEADTGEMDPVEERRSQSASPSADGSAPDPASESATTRWLPERDAGETQDDPPERSDDAAKGSLSRSFLPAGSGRVQSRQGGASEADTTERPAVPPAESFPESSRSASAQSGSDASFEQQTPGASVTNAEDKPPPASGSGDGAEVAGPGDQDDSSSGGAGRWSLLTGRSTGGPLSVDRVAREQAEQEREGGESEGPQSESEQSEEYIEPGGTMDPSARMRRIAAQISRGERDPETAEPEEEEEEAREGLARDGPLVWLIDHWLAIALPLTGVCMVVFVVATVGLPDLGGPSDEIASNQGAPGEPAGGSGNGARGSERPNTAPLYDSGLSFSLSQSDDGGVELSAGDQLRWTGELKQVTTEEARKPRESAAEAAVEVLRLSGPTAAEVSPSYTMDSGSENPGEVSTTVFAVVGEGVPDVHATFHMFSGDSADGSTQRANGTYDVTADSGELIAEGSYSDRRTGASGGEEVIRTYTEEIPAESGSRQFRVRYEAPPGVPVPLLVGWQPPDERPADLRLEGER